MNTLLHAIFNCPLQKGAEVLFARHLGESHKLEEFQKFVHCANVSISVAHVPSLVLSNARTPGRAVSTICDDLFDLHGAPPKGTAEDSVV